VLFCDMSKTYPGSRNPNWKGGRTIASSGYVLVKRPGHPLADSRGYAYEHRVVAMEKLGRPLHKGEVVHHINGDKLDNRPENLAVLPSNGHHMQAHGGRRDTRRLGEPNPIVACECGCGRTFDKYDQDGRPRRFVSGHNGCRVQ